MAIVFSRLGGRGGLVENYPLH